MRHPALLPAALVVAALTLVTTPVAAQHYGHPSHNDEYDRTGGWSGGATAGWRSQLDRPGDYRCDAFWDAGRTDCAAQWRDQRRYRSYGWNNAGYGQSTRYPDYGHADRNYGGGTYGGAQYGYSSRRRGYGRVPVDHDGGEAWHGAYGRPDLIYSDTDRRSGRDPRRIDWCRANYRSYDPASGYYRAYSGRLVYCG